MKKLFIKLQTILPAVALFLGVAALNSACVATYHQPEVPSSLDTYRK